MRIRGTGDSALVVWTASGWLVNLGFLAVFAFVAALMLGFFSVVHMATSSRRAVRLRVGVAPWIQRCLGGLQVKWTWSEFELGLA
jgi:hypothetical protein